MDTSKLQRMKHKKMVPEEVQAQIIPQKMVFEVEKATK
jgi:hypothetical protein